MVGCFSKTEQKNKTLIIGDLNINSWGREYTEWTTSEDWRALANPRMPTHRSGARDDTILVAVEDYMPEGFPPGEAETEKDMEKAEYYRVYTIADPLFADRMALSLAVRT